MTSSRERKPRSGRLKRFMGIACTRWIEDRTVGHLIAAKLRNEWTAASRALRLRAEFPRSCSRCARNATTKGASMSSSVRSVGLVRVRSWT